MQLHLPLSVPYLLKLYISIQCIYMFLYSWTKCLITVQCVILIISLNKYFRQWQAVALLWPRNIYRSLVSPTDAIASQWHMNIRVSSGPVNHKTLSKLCNGYSCFISSCRLEGLSWTIWVLNQHLSTEPSFTNALFLFY